jgi:hypothetical protein
MGKTDTIKDRTIYVYLPTPQMVERWKKAADQSKQSISKFVMERVEYAISEESEQDKQNRATAIEEIKRLTESLAEKDSKIMLQGLLIEKYEQDLRNYRSRLFSDESYTGVRVYDKELVQILREPGVHSYNEIIDRLRIKPSDSEAIRTVQRQLDNLRGYNLAKEIRGGWIWRDLK